MLSPNGEHSSLVLQLVLNDVKLAVWIGILHLFADWRPSEHLVLDKCAVLIQLELGNGTHGARLKVDPHELVLADDFLTPIQVLLRHIQRV